MGARDVLGRNELDRINEKSIDLNGYFGSVWSGLDLVLAVTPSARYKPKHIMCLGFLLSVIFIAGYLDTYYWSNGDRGLRHL